MSAREQAHVSVEKTSCLLTKHDWQLSGKGFSALAVKTFPRGGGSIPHRKDATENKAILYMPAPKEVVIPLQQHLGAPCEPLVELGESVKLGQKIGSGSHVISAAVHSSVSGRVKAVTKKTLVDGRQVSCIVIESDGRDEQVAGKQHTSLDGLSSERIRAIVKEAGIVGMGGAGFPTHVKFDVPKPVDTVIVNGAECEPYLTCDHRLLVERSKDVLFGLRAAMKAVDAENGIIGIEINKPDAIEAMSELVKDDPSISVAALQVRYPQGGEKQLIKAVTKREVPSGALPFEVQCLVSNVHTLTAVADAIQKGMTLYQRVVTVTGKHVHDPRNVMIRIGTPIRSVIEFCGGMAGTPEAVVAGGPMTGCRVASLDAPVVKAMSGLLLLSKDEVSPPLNEPCIRCARCVDACPMGLTPNMLGFYSYEGMTSRAEELYAMDCIECGLCSFVCPSGRELSDWIKQSKQAIAEQNSNK